MRLGGWLGSVFALVTCGVCIAAPNPRYQIIDLGVLSNGVSSVAMALNDKGEVVGDCETSDGVHAFLFSRRAMTDLNSFLRYQISGETFYADESHARDINNRGEVIGGARNINGARPQFLYVDGTVSYYGSSAYPFIDNQIFPVFDSINNRGHIRGLAGNAGLPAVTDRRIVQFYVSPDGQIVTYGLNKRDEATGYTAPSGPTFAFYPTIFRLNGNTQIPLPAGSIGGTGQDINDAGHVVGTYQIEVDGAEVWRAFLYRNGKTKDIANGTAVAINNTDEAVGNNGVEPFVYTGGRVFLLNQTISPGLGYEIQQANDINDDGIIAGSAVHDGQERAIVLLPRNRVAFLRERNLTQHPILWWKRAFLRKS